MRERKPTKREIETEAYSTVIRAIYDQMDMKEILVTTTFALGLKCAELDVGSEYVLEKMRELWDIFKDEV